LLQFAEGGALLRRDAFAGQSFDNANEIERAMQVDNGHSSTGEPSVDLGTTAQNAAPSASALYYRPLSNRQH